jgi:hypothetical protein
MPAAATNESANVSLLEIFKERCEARCLLVAGGAMPLIEAVDGLQLAAERTGLIDKLGQDEVQRIMGESFARWRLE